MCLGIPSRKFQNLSGNDDFFSISLGGGFCEVSWLICAHLRLFSTLLILPPILRWWKEMDMIPMALNGQTPNVPAHRQTKPKLPSAKLQWYTWVETQRSKQGTPRAVSLVRTGELAHLFHPWGSNMTPFTSQNTLDSHCYMMSYAPMPKSQFHSAIASQSTWRDSCSRPSPRSAAPALGSIRSGRTPAEWHKHPEPQWADPNIYLSLRVKNLATLGMIQICIHLYYVVPWCCWSLNLHTYT